MKIDKIKKIINIKLYIARKILVNNQMTKEIRIRYKLNFEKNFITKNIEPNSNYDVLERQEIKQKIIKKINLFENDIHSRQFVIQQQYIDNKELPACISCIQFLIRNNKIKAFFFVRSQNFDNNFDYDNQSYMIWTKQIADYFKIKIQSIEVIVSSLHRIL